jgi:IclR family transcriptional regulator, KDG regulon repressor
MKKSYQAPIVKKAFLILKAISKAAQGLRISEISIRLDISKSTVHGITAALEDQGALIRDPLSKRYSIGTTLMELGKAAYERMDFKKAARPIMEDLMAQCRESVFLGIRNKDSVTVIDIVESRKDFKISSPMGTSLPLLAGAVGKVFLAKMTQTDARDYIMEKGLVRFTPRTIVDVERYLKELEIVRKAGVAFDDEEYISGVKAVAAPIQEIGAYSPAIWVVGFATSMEAELMPGLMAQTRDASLAINKRLAETF